jgi:3-hydroxyisobutyrate dehydrogenase
MMAKIAMLGAGLIGAGLVTAALERGDEVVVYNRTESKARALESLGARVALTPAEAVQGVERVHIALSDDDAVEAVLAACGAIACPVVDHTTTQPARTAARVAALTERGIRYLHAPVFMSPQNARTATGLMLACGPMSLYDEVSPELARMTGRVMYLGDRPELAAAYKLFGNTMIIALTGGLADVFAQAEAVGVAPQAALDLFSVFNVAGIFQGRGKRMAEQDWSPSFELTMARKDVRLMIETAQGAPLAVLPGLAARMDALIEAGHGSEDLGVLAIRGADHHG